MKKIQDFDLKNKKVIIRCDLNVPVENNKILDNNRIKASLKSIKYLIKNNAKIIILSHLGRIKTKEDEIKNDLKPVSKELSKLLKQEVKFSEKTRGKELENQINNLKNKEVILIQNTRYEDLINKKESNCDEELSKYWASLGDIFINDAFGTAHRSHASNVGIAKYLPSGIGFLIQDELKNLEITKNPKRPYIVILGGAKVTDKIKVIENLAKKADYILIGGGMSYTFLKAAGFGIGNSLLDKDSIDFCINILKKYENKIILPIDSIVSEDLEGKNKRSCFINEIKEDEIGLDIGPQTLKVFKHYIDDAKLIVWNGPVGMAEIKEFSNGTKELSKIITSTSATTIVGGGDTANLISNKSKFTFISTGGGATLKYLEGSKMPALEVIK